MTPVYDIEILADRYEDQREYEAGLWAKIEASNAGEVTLSDTEAAECWAFLAGLLSAAD